MHKKERPMMSVTELLHGGGVTGGQIFNNVSQNNPNSISPTGTTIEQQLQQQANMNLVSAVQQHQQQQLLHQQNSNSPTQQLSSSVLQATSTSPQQLLVQNSTNSSLVCDNRAGNNSQLSVSPLPPSNVPPSPATPALGAGGGGTGGARYPPNHPLSGSKHLCAICEDRASGKHYGVYR